MSYYTVTDDRQFELQVFSGGEYKPVATGLRSELEAIFETMAGTIRRLVIPGKHPEKPKYRVPRKRKSLLERCNNTHFCWRSRDEEVIETYLRWAKGKGLDSVAIYEHEPFPRIMAERLNLTARKVSAADFLGDAPVEDED